MRSSPTRSALLHTQSPVIINGLRALPPPLFTVSSLHLPSSVLFYVRRERLLLSLPERTSPTSPIFTRVQALQENPRRWGPSPFRSLPPSLIHDPGLVT